MIHQIIKSYLNNAITQTASNIDAYTLRPGKDLSRSKKIPTNKLISYLITQGASSTGNELLDFFTLDVNHPSNSAFNQQRAKLKPEALQNVFYQFNKSASCLKKSTTYRYIATDGSTFTFDSLPRFSPDNYYVSKGHSAKGFYSMHVNAFFDLKAETYTDAIIQPIHQKNEFKAFCDIVDRHAIIPGCKNVYIGDRGYCSYNNMAHVLEQNQFFLFRTKDIHAKGFVSKFDLPKEESFDIGVTVTLVRSHSKKVGNVKGDKRFVDNSISFDYIKQGSLDTYEMSFRIVRFPISKKEYECIVTNLPKNEFPPKEIKKLYYSRWGIESSFRKLKYTIGLSNFHAVKPEYIKQEIWAKLIAYNATQLIINHIKIERKDTNTYAYKINFSTAVHICRIYLRLTTAEDSYDVVTLLKEGLVPIRKDRKFDRLQTAHFRRPRNAFYRAA